MTFAHIAEDFSDRMRYVTAQAGNEEIELRIPASPGFRLGQELRM
jgi:hypothetical protein